MAKTTSKSAAAKVADLNEADLSEANPDKTVPGPSPDAAANLMMADIAMRSGTTLLRTFVERTILKGRYGSDAAKNIVSNRGMKHTLASVAVAKIATRSVPGAVMIGGGLIVKALFDRGGQRRKTKREADRKLLKIADRDQ